MTRPMINARGGSRKWTKTVNDYIRVNQLCWLRFPRCTLRSETIDHYYPCSTHPHLINTPQNWRPACHYCNRARGNTAPHRIPALRAKLEKEFASSRRPKAALRFFG